VTKEEERLARAALDALDIGVLVVSPGQVLLLANAAARRLLAAGRAWICEEGRLRPADPRQAASFERSVRRASLAATPHTGPIFDVRPLPDASSAVVVLPRPDVEARLPVAAFARQHRLTPAETRLVAALAAGKRVAEYAAETGISGNTARTHLKQVFAKAGLRRQADLLRHVHADTEE
jgi:DNA-binding CsgD family transcriptional regulator